MAQHYLYMIIIDSMYMLIFEIPNLIRKQPQCRKKTDGLYESTCSQVEENNCKDIESTEENNASSQNTNYSYGVVGMNLLDMI